MAGTRRNKAGTKRRARSRKISRSSTKRPLTGTRWRRAPGQGFGLWQRRNTPVRSLRLYPEMKITKHRYVDVVSHPVGLAAGLSSFYTFRTNSTYDPDFTGTGHQPYYRDEMADIYTFYTVLRAYITVTIPNENTKQQVWGIIVDDTSGGGLEPTLSEICEHHNFSKVTKLDKLNSSLTLTASFNAAAWEKTSQTAFLADNENKVQVGANPTKGRYFVIWRAPVSSSTTTEAVDIIVNIVYEVAWRETTASGRS